MIFNAIKDLVSLSIAAKLPKSQQQIITYGLNILKSTGEFDTSLTKWYNLVPAETTWHNFIKYFTKAYYNILKIQGKTIKNTQLTVEFAQMRNKVLKSVNALT